eukprot:7414212-Alexandrium_andersonii.AAC.1
MVEAAIVSRWNSALRSARRASARWPNICCCSGSSSTCAYLRSIASRRVVNSSRRRVSDTNC